MPKSLADGHTKLTMLTTKPEDPNAPTVTELDAGVEISCDVLSSNYSFGATDSDKVAEKALCKEGNSNAIGASNYVADITLFRYYDATTGQYDATTDTSYQALKLKGTEAYLYERESGKLSTEAWAEDDEVTGMLVVTDNPQKPSDQGGYIKRRVPMEPQTAWYGTVAVAA